MMNNKKMNEVLKFINDHNMILNMHLHILYTQLKNTLKQDNPCLHQYSNFFGYF